MKKIVKLKIGNRFFALSDNEFCTICKKKGFICEKSGGRWRKRLWNGTFRFRKRTVKENWSYLPKAIKKSGKGFFRVEFFPTFTPEPERTVRQFVTTFLIFKFCEL